MSYLRDGGPTCPSPQRRRKAAHEAGQAQARAVNRVAGVDRGPDDRQDLLGQAWCDNLERYSDYANRLPRGRTYVRNGSVIDLQIATGKVAALVSGSDALQGHDHGRRRSTRRWKAICRDCAGAIDSLVELLQGRLSKGVMDRVCREDDGLFPAPEEIELLLQLSRLGRHVQARRGGAVRRRRAAGR